MYLLVIIFSYFLSSPDWSRREAASYLLGKCYPLNYLLLQELEKSDDLEASTRANHLLQRFNSLNTKFFAYCCIFKDYDTELPFLDEEMNKKAGMDLATRRILAEFAKRYEYSNYYYFLFDPDHDNNPQPYCYGLDDLRFLVRKLKVINDDNNEFNKKTWKEKKHTWIKEFLSEH